MTTPDPVGPRTPGPHAPAFTSTVVAPAQIALGVLSALVVAVILTALSSGLWPVAIIAALVIVGVAVYLATITFSVQGRRITIAQGRGEREPRIVHAAEIREQVRRDLTWPQAFGLGLESDDRTTRLTVRAGPTLFLTLTDGEQIRISVTDPEAALAAIDEARASS